MFENKRLIIISDGILPYNTPHNLYRNKSIDINESIRRMELPRTRENLKRVDELGEVLSKNRVYEVTITDNSIFLDWSLTDVHTHPYDNIDNKLLESREYFNEMVLDIVKTLIEHNMYTREFIYEYGSPFHTKYNSIKIKLKKEFIDESGEHPKYTKLGETFIREITYSYNIVYEDTTPTKEDNNYIFEIDLSRVLGGYHNELFIKKIFSYLDLSDLLNEGIVLGIFNEDRNYFSENDLSISLKINEKYYDCDPERLYLVGTTYIIAKKINKYAEEYINIIKKIIEYTELNHYITQQGCDLFLSLVYDSLIISRYLKSNLKIKKYL